METKEPKKYDVKETLDKLGTKPAQGLSIGEAKSRIVKYCTNEIPEKEVAAFQRIIKRLWGPIPWMIEIAAVLSAIVQKWDDFINSPAVC